MSNLPAVVSSQTLVVRQHKEMLEAFTDIETNNRYTVQSPDGKVTLFAAETGSGFGAFLTRGLLKAKRPFTILTRDASGSVALNLRRPWTWFFSHLDVMDGTGRLLGTVQQRFAFFARRFSVLDANGNEVAELHGPFFRPWTFRVLVGGQEVGKISKRWSGMLREAFTDADTFGVEFGPSMSPDVRVLVLGATFLIDFLYFEDKD